MINSATELTQIIPAVPNSGLGMVREPSSFDFLTYLMGLNGTPLDTTPELNFIDSPFVKTDESSGSEDPIVRKSRDESNTKLFAPLDLSTTQRAELLKPLTNGLKEVEEFETDSSVKGQYGVQTKRSDTNRGDVKTDVGADLFLRQIVAQSNKGETGRRETVESSQILANMELPKNFDKTPARVDSALNRYRGLGNANNRSEIQVGNESSVQMKPSFAVTPASEENNPGVFEIKEQDREIRIEGSDKKDVSLGRMTSEPMGIQTRQIQGSELKSPVKHVEKLSIPEVFERIEHLAHNGGGEIRVSLSPPELGRVEIHVATKGNQVEILMHSESAMAKTTLENSLSDLRQSLSSLDLNLTRIEVFTGHAANFNFQDGSQSKFSHSEFGGGSFFGEANRKWENSSVHAVQTKRFRPIEYSGGLDLKI